MVACLGSGVFAGDEINEVSSVNRATNEITVKDCNYNDDYYGTFTVSAQEAYDSIYDSRNLGELGRRYLIYA